jgi:hypothetical protein
MTVDEVTRGETAVGQVSGRPHEEAEEHDDPHRCNRGVQPGGMTVTGHLRRLDQEDRDQAEERQQHGREPKLVGELLSNVEFPGTAVDQLEHAAEAQSEDEDGDDCDEGRAELVPSVADQDVADGLRCRSGQVVSADQVVGERCRIPLQVLGEDEDCREDREEHVHRQQEGLQWTVDSAKVLPPGQRDPTARSLVSARYPGERPVGDMGGALPGCVCGAADPPS